MSAIKPFGSYLGCLYVNPEYLDAPYELAILDAETGANLSEGWGMHRFNDVAEGMGAMNKLKSKPAVAHPRYYIALVDRRAASPKPREGEAV